MEDKKDTTVSDQPQKLKTPNSEYKKGFSLTNTEPFIIKKVEKIVLALYLITGVFPEHEPLKERLRQKSLELFDCIFYLKDKFINENASIAYGRLILLDIDCLLSIGKQSGIVSSMNYEILEKEIYKVINSFKEISDEVLKEASLFSPGFFSVEATPPELLSDKKDIYKRQYIKDSREEKNMSFTSTSKPLNIEEEKKEHSLSALKKINRVESILDIIKIKKKVTIKDISLIIKDCSEKTIQRELGSLLKKGIIQREGERRWSTYSFSD
ncbi:MAG: hypothetical protein KAR00_02425 [Candidatus Pacebacteria bacterium]|nr:hypothetical protein [Candidatus Paceibacterota bacterium]